jgi:outer membrane receptor protein involved in Fe transport
VRAPAPVDANLAEFAGTRDFLGGSTGFHPETLTAYELGTREEISPGASFSVSTYYDIYDHLRTIDPGTPTGPVLQFRRPDDRRRLLLCFARGLSRVRLKPRAKRRKSFLVTFFQ